MWIADGSRLTQRVGLCVDSLLAIDYRDFEGCDLIIDEADQVFQHLLTSSTCNKDGKRPALLARIHELIRVARRVIIDSADLTDREIHYVLTLKGSETPVHFIHNTHQAAGYHTSFIHSTHEAAIIERIRADLEQGLKLFIATDALSTSKTLARLLKKWSQQLVLINSETSSGEFEIDFIRQINQQVGRYQGLIATPSMATGVSIEVKHFDKVYGLFQGVLSDGDICQALARVRAPIPQVIWCVPTGKNFCRVSRSEYPSQIREALRTQWDKETRLLRHSLRPDISLIAETEFNWDTNPHLKLWTEYAAQGNGSLWNLRDNLLARLQAEGHTVDIIEEDPPDDGKAAVKEARHQTKQAQYQVIANAQPLTPTEFKALQHRKGRTHHS